MTTMKNVILLSIALLLSAGAAAAPVPTPQGSPARLVEELHAALLASMKSGRQQSCPQRFEALLPVVRASFDFPFIARLAVGRNWRRLDDDQRQALITAMTRMSAATYARHFDNFSGQRFETLEVRQSRETKAIVKTLLITDREKGDLDYICRKNPGGWRIVSVSARGVNDLSMKRAEYTRFLKDHDIAALVAKINAKTDRCTGGKTP